MLNPYLVFVIALLIMHWLVDAWVNFLNLRHVQTGIPPEFEGWLDQDKYARSQQYLRENTRFDLISDAILLPLTLGFILLGGFALLDRLARSAGGNMIITGLLFAGMLLLIGQLISLPFSAYSTFVIEERYGFNRTTWPTFILDRIKSLLLTLLLGAPIFAGILWFFAYAGPHAWLYSWIVVTAIQIFIMFIAPVVILPLFNKFIPLEEGPLRNAIQHYAEAQNFKLQGIFKIDGSRRSTKSNAYFTGFGRWRRIALFDTLIEKHSVDELVAVLAHEVGHYKQGHITRQLVLSAASNLLMFYLLSLFISQADLYHAFSVSIQPIAGHPPIYAGIVFFGFLYTPISFVIGLFVNMLSRRFEYQADAFAVKTTDCADALITALKKLSVDNLSNLTPHPLKVLLEYSHPPVIERIHSMRRMS